MKRISNMTAAFPEISREIRDIGLVQHEYFRTDKFDNLVVDVKEMIKSVSGANNNYHVGILTSSGTGAMDAALLNFIGIDDKIMIVIGGRFGSLWRDMCIFYGYHFTVHEVEPGFDLDLKKLEKQMAQYRPSVLLMQHNETSTMQLFDINGVGSICEKLEVLFVLDACSSFVIDNLNVIEDKIHILVSSSQKGLALPAGLAFLIFNKDLERRAKSFYLDLSMYNASSGCYIQPFTPPVSLFHQLQMQLTKIRHISLGKWIEKYATQAEHFRSLIRNLPLKIIAQHPSNCGTAIYAQGVDNCALCEELRHKGIYIVNSKGWWGDYLSIGHIGDISHEDNLRLVEGLRKWIEK